MTLLLHIIIALSSLLFTTYLYFRPSQAKFYTAYGLIAATLLSGTYLVVSLHAPLMSSCMSGLVYIVMVGMGVFAARAKSTNA